VFLDFPSPGVLISHSLGISLASRPLPLGQFLPVKMTSKHSGMLTLVGIQQEEVGQCRPNQI